jgi:hypothetical protein
MGAEVSRPFDKFAGISAILAAGVSVLYGVFFALALRGSETTATPSAVLLMVSGLLGIVVVCALYLLFKNLDVGFALLALVLGVLGAGGAFVHGAYDLSTLVSPGEVVATGVSAVDPRGVLVFGISGLSVLIFARLIVIGTRLPLKLGWIGYGLAGLLLLLYLGRLLVLDPSQPFLRLSAILAGFVLNPLWNLWIGVELIRGE